MDLCGSMRDRQKDLLYLPPIPSLKSPKPPAGKSRTDSVSARGRSRSRSFLPLIVQEKKCSTAESTKELCVMGPYPGKEIKGEDAAGTRHQSSSKPGPFPNVSHHRVQEEVSPSACLRPKPPSRLPPLVSTLRPDMPAAPLYPKPPTGPKKQRNKTRRGLRLVSKAQEEEGAKEHQDRGAADGGETAGYAVVVMESPTEDQSMTSQYEYTAEDEERYLKELEEILRTRPRCSRLHRYRVSVSPALSDVPEDDF